jgi:uncharacterized membrane protein (UPF0136 family)
MPDLPTTHLVAAVVTILYGLISLTGGIMGYVKAHSVPSLVAGGIAGVLLILCGVGIAYYPVPSLVAAKVLAALLAIRFAIAWVRKKEAMSRTMYITSLVMILGAVIVLSCAAVAVVH